MRSLSSPNSRSVSGLMATGASGTGTTMSTIPACFVGESSGVKLVIFDVCVGLTRLGS